MPDLPPPVPAAQLSLATHGMSKGISQTDGSQLVARALLRVGSIEAGGQWKNVDTSHAGGEASLFVNASRKLGSVQLTGTVAAKFWTGSPTSNDRKAIEFSVTALRKFGPLTARGAVVYSPNELGDPGRSLFVEAGPQLDLGHGWSASAALARRQFADRPDYSAVNIGAGRKLGKLTLDLRYYATNRSDLGRLYRPRAVAAAKLSF